MMTSGVTVSTREAAELLGMDRLTLSRWISDGRCPFGTYIKSESRQRGSYYINRIRLEMYLTGKDMNPIVYKSLFGAES
jgi:predicted site-specific integrase-resolvase